MGTGHLLFILSTRRQQPRSGEGALRTPSLRSAAPSAAYPPALNAALARVLVLSAVDFFVGGTVAIAPAPARSGASGAASSSDSGIAASAAEGVARSSLASWAAAATASNSSCFAFCFLERQGSVD